MFLSLCYVMLRRILELAALRFRSNDFKDLEIVVLRHELAILRRRTRRPVLTRTDRLFLAATRRLPPRARWRTFIITPTTLLRWHRRLPVRCENLGYADRTYSRTTPPRRSRRWTRASPHSGPAATDGRVGWDGLRASAR